LRKLALDLLEQTIDLLAPLALLEHRSPLVQLPLAFLRRLATELLWWRRRRHIRCDLRTLFAFTGLRRG
jgi:hypothetical protein